MRLGCRDVRVGGSAGGERPAGSGRGPRGDVPGPACGGVRPTRCLAVPGATPASKVRSSAGVGRPPMRSTPSRSIATRPGRANGAGRPLIRRPSILFGLVYWCPFTSPSVRVSPRAAIDRASTAGWTRIPRRCGHFGAGSARSHGHNMVTRQDKTDRTGRYCPDGGYEEAAYVRGFPGLATTVPDASCRVRDSNPEHGSWLGGAIFSALPRVMVPFWCRLQVAASHSGYQSTGSAPGPRTRAPRRSRTPPHHQAR